MRGREAKTSALQRRSKNRLLRRLLHHRPAAKLGEQSLAHGRTSRTVPNATCRDQRLPRKASTRHAAGRCCALSVQARQFTGQSCAFCRARNAIFSRGARVSQKTRSKGGCRSTAYSRSGYAGRVACIASQPSGLEKKESGRLYHLTAEQKHMILQYMIVQLAPAISEAKAFQRTLIMRRCGSRCCPSSCASQSSSAFVPTPHHRARSTCTPVTLSRIVV